MGQPQRLGLINIDRLCKKIDKVSDWSFRLFASDRDV